jgi:hypothetical protein
VPSSDDPFSWVEDEDVDDDDLLDVEDLLFDETIEDAPEGDLPPPEPPEPPSLVELFLGLWDAASAVVLDRPIVPRLKLTPAGLMRGEVDVVKVEIPGFAASGLVFDRFLVRAERVRMVPGFPPHIKAGPVGLKAVVSQENVDRWTRVSRLPVRLRLTPEGVVMTTGVRGIKMGRLLAELTVVGSFLQLRPRSASFLGMPAPLARFFRGYLPLPPLPKGARLRSVEPGDGELCVTLVIDEVDEAITPDVAKRLQRLIRLPIPGL